MAKYPLTLLPVVSVTAGSAQLAPPAGVPTDAQYGTPAHAVAKWVQAGAFWVHVLDADAANGQPDNGVLIAAARSAHVQLAGGISSPSALEAALRTGCARVVIDAADRDWAASAIKAHGERIAVSLNVRQPDLESALESLESAGCARYVVSDEVTHGHWHHGDKHLLEEFCTRTRRPVMAQGGISHLDDLHRLHELVPQGLDAIILGAPLYDGSFTFSEAMAASADRFDLFFWGPPQP